MDRNITNKELKEQLKIFATFLGSGKEKQQLYFFEETDIRQTNRKIEGKKIDFGQNEEVICTTYFTGKKDPQRNRYVEKDTIEYIAPWYNSVKQLGLYGLVFHDGLSNDFINRYETDKIRFIACQLGDYSLNDERFLLYYLFFMEHKFDYVLFSDGNDVRFTKNPFDLIRERNNTIFVGRDKERLIKHSWWNIKSARKLQKNLKESFPSIYYDMPIYNAGILGGDYETIMFFLRQMVQVFFKADASNNNNMAVLHYVLFKSFVPNIKTTVPRLIPDKLYKKLKIFFYEKIVIHRRMPSLIVNFFIKKTNPSNDKQAVTPHIFSGFPLNSTYYQYEKDSEAYIIHK